MRFADWLSSKAMDPSFDMEFDSFFEVLEDNIEYRHCKIGKVTLK